MTTECTPQEDEGFPSANISKELSLQQRRLEFSETCNRYTQVCEGGQIRSDDELAQWVKEIGDKALALEASAGVDQQVIVAVLQEQLRIYTLLVSMFTLEKNIITMRNLLSYVAGRTNRRLNEIPSKEIPGVKAQ